MSARAHRRVRLALVTALVLLAATSMGAAGAPPARAAPTASTVRPARTQELAALIDAHHARSKPSVRSAPLELVHARRPITGEQTVLPVLGHRTSADGLRWLHVRLPGRPNGHTGWIKRRATVSSTTSWRIVVNPSRRRVLVYHRGRLVRVFRAVVGKPSTPTPRGQFFVEESILLRPSGVGAPFALALSARSNVLRWFDGGPGQIGLHGLANVGGVPGTAVSHGCVRLGSSAMRWLVARVGPGAPVTITG